MRKYLALLAAVLFCSQALYAQTGKGAVSPNPKDPQYQADYVVSSMALSQMVTMKAW